MFDDASLSPAVTDGIEVTTGPLGQGISNAVGLAIAEAHIAATFNKPDLELINNYTYCFLGDGCLQEGVASEACSLAGHLQLGRLIAVYDDNKITIDGDTAVSFTEDVEMRFKSYGWQVLHVENGDTDLEGMYNAIAEAQKETNKPTLIRLRTTIGFGSKLQGTHGVHGNPLKPDDAQAIKKLFGFNPDETFAIPEGTQSTYSQIREKGEKLNAEWNKLFEEYKSKYPKEFEDLQRRIDGKLPQGWEKALPVYKPDDPAVASRKLSETVISKIADAIPEFICGVSAVQLFPFTFCEDCHTSLVVVMAPRPITFLSLFSYGEAYTDLLRSVFWSLFTFPLVSFSSFSAHLNSSMQSADLTGSNLTRWKSAEDFQPPSTNLGSYAGRYIRYGVREHGMGAIMNGIAAYGKGLIIPAGGTFLNFVSCESVFLLLSRLLPVFPPMANLLLLVVRRPVESRQRERTVADPNFFFFVFCFASL